MPRTRLVFGAGTVAHVGGRRVLLVTDPGLVKAGLHVSVFDRAKVNRTTRCVDECVA